MRKFIYGVLFFATLISHATIADSPAPPRSFVTTHPYCSCYFIMIPEKIILDESAQTSTRTPAFGKAFRLNDDGSSTLMWEVSGWYSFENYLSWDGRYLVRMGDWPQGKSVSKDHMAVTFYDKGKELKQYSTADLVRNPQKIQRTISHYFWQSGGPTYPRIEYKNNFLLKTIDGYVHEFDMETGELIKSSKTK